MGSSVPGTRTAMPRRRFLAATLALGSGLLAARAGAAAAKPSITVHKSPT